MMMKTSLHDYPIHGHRAVYEIRRFFPSTPVIVSALRSDRGASRVLLTAALERLYPVLASVPLMLQYESVLTRSEHLAAAGVSSADVEILLDAIALTVEPIRISY